MVEKRRENVTRPKWQRVLACCGIGCLIALYLLTFVAALCSSPASNGLFLASLTLTFVIPASIYVFIWLHKVVSRKEEE